MSWNCPSVPLAGVFVDFHLHAQHEKPWSQQSWCDLLQQIIPKFIGQPPKCFCSYTEMCLKDLLRKSSCARHQCHACSPNTYIWHTSLIKGVSHSTWKYHWDVHGFPLTSLPQYVSRGTGQVLFCSLAFNLQEPIQIGKTDTLFGPDSICITCSSA